MTSKASFLVQVEVSPPQADDLGRVRQITQEKEALAQQRASADQARKVRTLPPFAAPHILPNYGSLTVPPHYLNVKALGSLPTSSAINTTTHVVSRREIRLFTPVLLLELFLCMTEAMHTFGGRKAIRKQQPNPIMLTQAQLLTIQTLHCETPHCNADLGTPAHPQHLLSMLQIILQDSFSEGYTVISADSTGISTD